MKTLLHVQEGHQGSGWPRSVRRQTFRHCFRRIGKKASKFRCKLITQVDVGVPNVLLNSSAPRDERMRVWLAMKPRQRQAPRPKEHEYVATNDGQRYSLCSVASQSPPRANSGIKAVMEKCTRTQYHPQAGQQQNLGGVSCFRYVLSPSLPSLSMPAFRIPN